MDVEAIVLAGGRGSRLGGIDKAALEIDGESMLDRTLRAVTGMRVILVGAESLGAESPDAASPRITLVWEHPRSGGPAAGIGAGLVEVTTPYVLIVACDTPFLDEALPVLLDSRGEEDGAIAVDGSGRRQNLMIVVRTEALADSAALHSSLDGLSVRTLLAPLSLIEVPVPARSTLDLDTWNDVEKARDFVGNLENDHD